jgi:hypothetical protein
MAMAFLMYAFYSEFSFEGLAEERDTIYGLTLPERQHGIHPTDQQSFRPPALLD